MALARCEKCGHPQGLKLNYNHLHAPAPSVSSRILCGVTTCNRPAYIWLTDEEEQQYLHGQRNFRLSNHAVQVQVV